MSLASKYQSLQKNLSELSRVAIAFSGGVDSTLLLKVACDLLGPQQVLALTSTSPVFPQHETDWCKDFTRQLGVRHILFHGDELELAGFIENSPHRCFHCKQNLYQHFLTITKEQGFAVLLDGSNLDDLKDYRPGREAVTQLGIGTPLVDAGLNKNDIRALSRQLELPTWNKPAFACLATRFPYGTPITREKLEQVGNCESWLYQQGFSTYRVRIHDRLARIEIAPDEMPRLLDTDLKEELIRICKVNGFDYVTLDLQGYRSGSMNECLPENGKAPESG
jgi:uncharacterized protein